MRISLFLVVLCCTTFLWGQGVTIISGSIKDAATKNPIQNVVIKIDGSSKEFFTDNQGHFEVTTSSIGEQYLKISALDFLSKQFMVALDGEPINLGDIFLEQDITLEKTANLITLTDNDIAEDDATVSGSSGLLQSTKDIFLNRAAFDFGQAFFRVRGYDSSYGKVLLNGIPMNKLFDGRPQWNNWGGLNDVIRNQEFSSGLAPNRYTFGGILGNTNINTRPSQLRSGIRLSSSASNRTYSGRLMATYNSGVQANGLAYTISLSRRWAKTGYMEGTLYNAYSFFGALEYKLNHQNSLGLTTILAKNRRGRSSAITEEVFNLMGNRYNPYWGSQEGNIRNSRERTIFEPLVILNHFLRSDKCKLTTGIAYQFGNNNRSRLGYYNAPNPDPTYYRYLPSFNVNSPIGADFTNASLAKEGFLRNPQIQWAQIYNANSNTAANGKAAYLLYDDVVEDKLIAVSSSFDYKISDNMSFGAGVHYKTLSSENFARIQDVLGADFHEDMDAFSNTLNDINGSETKTEGEKFNYDYALNTSEVEAFGQMNLTFKRWSGFASGTYSNFGTLRNGLFQNERFLENSFGNSEKISFSDFGFKSGGTYFISGRHWLNVNGAIINKHPTLQNIFINPRENNNSVPEIQQETISSLDVNYIVKLPDVTGRISAFYSRFQNTTDINFFFVDSGLGSDFVQEVITGLDRLHKGIELGVVYEVSSSVKLSLVGNLASYVYASNPSVEINFDTVGLAEELIAPEGNIDLGIAQLKDLKLAQGPQTAFAFGVEYRSPKYWWLGATTNYLADNYANVSTITRTQSFLIDPDTGLRFPDATIENVAKILEQQKLDDFYLLNLVGGKSWLVNKKYISAFVSVNNAFDQTFRTGGFEQSRNGNYGQLKQDNLSGSPSFGPKYWYGFGRTYFLNLAISF
ncbi:carboxypeptidase-like regulatory domain-containing protein [Flagellimonas sp. 389]|uniref:TonB-dependent receptor n=1 Tax=Flagellimonas sp. 389 TaxID=2835862 RepID=UPI001BD41486|nr:TonB-dependent receptor [Flagellimonas sp. 389]MBS9462526.1 carboxypeptidase-like regulatory domain-containing protein [Flagellimonas sp. 389]